MSLLNTISLSLSQHLDSSTIYLLSYLKVKSNLGVGMSTPGKPPGVLQEPELLQVSLPRISLPCCSRFDVFAIDHITIDVLIQVLELTNYTKININS